MEMKIHFLRTLRSKHHNKKLLSDTIANSIFLHDDEAILKVGKGGNSTLLVVLNQSKVKIYLVGIVWELRHAWEGGVDRVKTTLYSEGSKQ